MVLVFDLDDTLYEELSFVKGGFRAVSEYLGKKYEIPSSSAYGRMMDLLEKGRGSIFDSILKENGIFSTRLRDKLVSVYRRHVPEIKLYPDADRVLGRFSDLSLYIVTDGNKMVQASKVKALKLEERVKKVYITHRYGLDKAKPSPFCFLRIAEREKANPSEVVYIGDNPAKDFVGIKPLGFKTVQILRGPHAGLYSGEEYKADQVILSLDELSF